MKIKLITDSASDLPLEFVKDNDIDFVPLGVNIDGNFILDDLGENFKMDEFYSLIRQGKMPSTSQANVFAFEEIFEKYVKEGYKIIYIGLSSALSGTFNSSVIARNSVLEKYNDADISVIDSKSVSLGEGLLVYKACELINKGLDKEEIVKFIENIKEKVIHSIVVDDLAHLKRGGRISGATATVGSILNIKPTLTLDNEGKVVVKSKIKGKKKAIKYLASEIKDNAIDLENQTIFICHADCLTEAEELKNIILEESTVKDVIINSIGVVIGTHGGPGTLAAVFIGKERI
ncbi:DegV family protein [Clostridium ihumii]|uniref:DegV family protein n=1 Tax=Clostridium ihumii TaxID=1470356 RepID=UPI00058BF9DD|nr:DegV family protein [Clostridium ihumii]